LHRKKRTAGGETDGDMKRGWLIMLAIVLPVFGLQLALRAMETAPSGSADDPQDGPGPVVAAPIPPSAAEPAGAELATEEPAAAERFEEPVAVEEEPPRLRRVAPPEAASPWSFETAAAQAQIVEPPGGLPGYLCENADTYTQLYRGYTRPGWLTFGLYSDGTLRMVDIDGRSFQGRLIGTSATLRENDATSSFEVTFTVAGSNGRRRVAFRGGRHDAQELEIEPIRQAPTASR
jgi:hypothetical protein